MQSKLPLGGRGVGASASPASVAKIRISAKHKLGFSLYSLTLYSVSALKNFYVEKDVMFCGKKDLAKICYAGGTQKSSITFSVPLAPGTANRVSEN